MRDAALEAMEMVYGRERGDLERDKTLERALRYQVIVIGEAASSLDKELQDTSSAIPWKDIIGMRHIIVHGYELVDPDEVWEVVSRDIPALLEELEC
ncbi:MAG: HepT-like ribonuclease domain-containing protein [Armatimonadota bacterium]